jgi:hypothetical protein
MDENIWAAYRATRKRRLQGLGAGLQGLVSDHLQMVLDSFSLICGCINGDLNVEKLGRKMKIVGEAQCNALYEDH